MPSNEDKIATYVLVSGGHTVQCLALAKRMEKFAQTTYLVFTGDPTIMSRLGQDQNFCLLPNSLQEVRRKPVIRVFCDLPNFFKAIYLTVHALKKFRTDVLISTGSGPAISTMIAAKLLGIKIVFVESATRIATRSLCGLCAYYCFADLFFIQWPEMKKLYPRGIFAGRLL